jgi:hypothetical protein
MYNARSTDSRAERELATLNAKAEAARVQDAEDWEDAALDTALDCTRLCANDDGSIHFAVDPDGT